MVLIDDATNWTYAKFFESETTAAAMSGFAEYVGLYGLPRSLYVDRASIYETTRDSTVAEALQAVGPLTQFGRTMRELEVELILARSPQAKGRVERAWGVSASLREGVAAEEDRHAGDGTFLKWQTPVTFLLWPDICLP